MLPLSIRAKIEIALESTINDNLDAYLLIEIKNTKINNLCLEFSDK